ncbi:MAG: hypothetical protein AMXMBFR55_10920 [Gemmatimonadota bacterium]
MAMRAKSAPRKSVKRVASESARRKHSPKPPQAKKRRPSPVKGSSPAKRAGSARPAGRAKPAARAVVAEVVHVSELAAPEAPLAQRVMEAAAQVADDYVERAGEKTFGLSVHGVLLTVVVEERRQVARIIAPLFSESACPGDLLAATNEMNARHIAYGYTYVRDGEVRYAVEVLLAPFRAEAVGRALQVAAAVVRGLGMEVDEETRRWVGVGE